MPPEQPGLPRFLISCLLSIIFSFPLFAADGPGEDSTLLSPSSAVKHVFLRQDVVQYAKQFLGLSYRYGGRSPDTGFDCSGFTAHVMGLFDVVLSRSSRMQALQGQEVPLEAVRPGDLITFRRSRQRAVSHVAMVVDNNEKGIFIIHSTSRGVVIDNLRESRYWRPKVFEARDVLTAVTGPAFLSERQLLVLLKKELLPLTGPLLDEVPMLPPIQPGRVGNRKNLKCKI